MQYFIFLSLLLSVLNKWYCENWQVWTKSRFYTK